MNLKVIKWPLAIILGLCLMTVMSPATATAFTDLTISGDIVFDADSTAESFGASGSGDMTLVSGGSSTQTTFNELGVTGGANPLAGSLTAVGDGIGGNATFSGAFDSEYVSGMDLTLNLSNTSATDSFLVSFRLDYDNSVDSSGDEAYGQSQFFLGTSAGDNDVFETFLISDTYFGNENTDGSATGSGGLLTESGLFDFDVFLAPLTSFDLFGEYSLFGGVFAPGTSMASIDAFLTITEVVNETTPPPIPEPSTVALLGLGLVGLGIMAHRRRKNS